MRKHKTVTLFAYKGLDINGETVSGRLESNDEESAKAKLVARSISPYSIKALPTQVELSFRSSKIKPIDVSRFVKQLSTLLSAGVSIVDAFSSLSKAGANKGLANAAQLIATDLRAGIMLSEALQTRLPELPSYVSRLAELGEATGQSAKALEDASERMEFQMNLRNEIRTALSYPLFLSVVGSFLILLMFIFVVPRFETLLGEDKSQIPAISRYVIDTGSWVSQNYITFFAGILLFVALAIVSFRSSQLRSKLMQSIERLPAVGPLLIQADLGGWARTVGIALDNGADLIVALNLGQDSLRSEELKNRFSVVHSQIRSGTSLEIALTDNVPNFDQLAIDLIKTGRVSGQLPKMLLFIGKTEEDATRTRSKRFASIAEPIAILTISAVIGLIVISIVLAMTSVYDIAG